MTRAIAHAPGAQSPRTLQELLRDPAREVPSWIRPGFLPKGGKLLFGGAAKIGKSLIMLEIARALAAGVRPFDYHHLDVPEPARVLIIEQEIGEAGLRKRADLIFAEGRGRAATSRIHVVSKDPLLVLSDPAGRSRLRWYVEQVEPDVLILDPISKFHYYDESDPAQIGQLLGYLDALIREHSARGMSIIFSHHFRKGPATDQTRAGYDPLDPYNFGGSRKWFDDPDTLVTLVREPRAQGGRLDRQASARSWRLRARITMRHDEDPGDIYLDVNREGHLEVRYGGRYEPPDLSLASLGKGRRAERVPEGLALPFREPHPSPHPIENKGDREEGGDE